MNGVRVMVGVKNIYIALTIVKGVIKWFNGNWTNNINYGRNCS